MLVVGSAARSPLALSSRVTRCWQHGQNSAFTRPLPVAAYDLLRAATSCIRSVRSSYKTRTDRSNYGTYVIHLKPSFQVHRNWILRIASENGSSHGGQLHVIE
jgi:hypothetical protein